MSKTAFKVVLPKKVLKQLDRLPEAVQDAFLALVEDLKAKGPLQPTWPNYSKLGVNKTIVISGIPGWRAGGAKREQYKSR